MISISRDSLNRAKEYKPLLIKSKKLSIYPLLSSSSIEKSPISALGDNSGNIFLVDNDQIQENLFSTEINICDSSIFDLCWYNPQNLAIATGEIQLLIFDIQKSNLKALKGHQKTIRSIKRNKKVLLSGGGDGKVILWDLRLDKPVIEMFLPKKAKNIISAIDAHKNENIIFGTSTPGTSLNIWDLRYTKRGLYLPNEQDISNKITNDIFHFENFLYLTLSDGTFLRTTETGIFMNNLSNRDSYNLQTGKIDFDYMKDFVIAGLGEKIVILDINHPGNPNILQIGQNNGICNFNKDGFFVYDDSGEMKIFDFFYGGINDME